MSNQVLQWQKQHQADLQMLACKEQQLKAFQEEMMALKESLLVDGKEVGARPQHRPPVTDGGTCWGGAVMPEQTRREQSRTRGGCGS